MKRLPVIFGALLLVLLLLTTVVFADGTETLGDPSIPIGDGTGMVAAGIGLQNTQPGTININVPGDVVQVLLYWSGTVTTDSPSDDTIEVDGNEITGTLIGGQAFFFDGPNDKQYYDSNYRADITELQLVSSGANSLSVEGLDNLDGDGNGANAGAGILVIYDDGSIKADLGIKDGLDLAYANFPEPRQTTVPQTFTFPPSQTERTASLVTFASSVGDNRPNTIMLDSDAGDIADVEDVLASVDGDLWDTITLEVIIPANATEVTMEIVSGSSSPGDPASLNWIVGSLAVPPPLGSIGDYVWYDENGDGVQDSSENGIPGIRVRLLRVVGNVLEEIDEDTTDAQGLYLFEDLPTDNYIVDVHNPDITAYFDPDGWLLTTNNEPYPYTLAPGEHHREADFGYDILEGLVGMGDWVWYDKDEDGTQNERVLPIPPPHTDPDDFGIPCVTVQLLDINGNVIDETTTDSWGYYYFLGLPPTTPLGTKDGYATKVYANDVDIDPFVAWFEGGSGPKTCTPDVVPTTLFAPMADITTPPGIEEMFNSDIAGTLDLTLDYGFYDEPTAISLASFEVTEAASTPGNLVLAAVVMALLGTGAWLLRRRQAVK